MSRVSQRILRKKSLRRVVCMLRLLEDTQKTPDIPLCSTLYHSITPLFDLLRNTEGLHRGPYKKTPCSGLWEQGVFSMDVLFIASIYGIIIIVYINFKFDLMVIHVVLIPIIKINSSILSTCIQ